MRRLILCCGKIYYDLAGHEMRADNPYVAIGRVELLYPFPQAEILALVESYPDLKEVVWVQEEPRNMGARAHMCPRLMQILPSTSVRLHRASRACRVGGGLPGRPRQGAEPDHLDGAQRRRSRVAVSRASCPASGSWRQPRRGRVQLEALAAGFHPRRAFLALFRHRLS